MPKISVIICVHNEELCLLNALRSIKLNNIYEDVEVIIINDCSVNLVTKRILSLLERLGCYKLIHSPVNLGLSNSRNLGFENATAEYVAPLDADDTFPIGSLDKIYDTFRDNPNIDFIYGDYKLINLEKKHSELISCSVITEDDKINLRAIFKNWILMGQSPCRKSVWSIVGGYALKYTNSVQDVDFWIRVFQQNFNGFYLPENIYNWNRSSEGMNETFDRTDYYLLLKEHYLFLSKFQNKSQLANTISEGLYKHRKLKELVIFNVKYLLLLNYKNILRPMLLVWSNLKK